MESLKKIGDLGKQHWEKLLLIAALIVLGVAVCYLYLESQKEKEKIQEFFTDVGRKSNKPVPPADLTNYQAIVAVAQNPPRLEFGLPHNLLNPVKWKRAPDDSLIKEQKGNEVLDLLQITSIRPLNFVIAVSRATGPGFWIDVTNQVATINRRISQFATLNQTNTRVFILREVKGPAVPEEEAPKEAWLKEIELVLELKESGEKISITKEKPYIRAEAYEADLRFPPENKTFMKQRVGAKLIFAGEEYKIVAITQTEIQLMAANDKKYTVRFNPGSSTTSSAGGAAR